LAPQSKPGFSRRPARRVQLGQRVALYCRVSTADQSCARQERDLIAFAARADYQVVGTFKETGSGMKLERVERRKVMALAHARHIDAVLVTELSRWGRSTTDLLATLKELETRHVSLIALNGMAFDLATPHGRMIATVLAGIAEFERDLSQERIRSGIAAAKARGKRLGRQPGQRLRLPSFLYCTESIGEHLLFREHRGEPFDQRGQPLLWHRGYQVVQHATLTEQRMGAPFAGVRFEQPVITESLARRSEQRQQSDGQSVQQPQPVAADG